MAPAVRDGERVLVVPTTPAGPRLGTILKVRVGDEFRMHRLIGRSKGSDTMLMLVGDNAVHRDAPIPASDVIGIAMAVERGGRVIRLDSAWSRWRGLLRVRRHLAAVWWGR